MSDFLKNVNNCKVLHETRRRSIQKSLFSLFGLELLSNTEVSSVFDYDGAFERST